jgi:hypothetical protein
MELMKEAPDGDVLLKALENKTGFADDFSFSRAVEELFMLDNIDVLKWEANRQLIESEGMPPLFAEPDCLVGVEPSPSAKAFLLITSRPAFCPAWLLAAYPDVILWLNRAVHRMAIEDPAWYRDEMPRCLGIFQTMPTLCSIIEGAGRGGPYEVPGWQGIRSLARETLADVDKGMAHNDEREICRIRLFVKALRSLVDYYRKRVNWKLECEP